MTPATGAVSDEEPQHGTGWPLRVLVAALVLLGFVHSLGGLPPFGGLLPWGDKVHFFVPGCGTRFDVRASHDEFIQLAWILLVAAVLVELVRPKQAVGFAAGSLTAASLAASLHSTGWTSSIILGDLVTNSGCPQTPEELVAAFNYANYLLALWPLSLAAVLVLYLRVVNAAAEAPDYRRWVPLRRGGRWIKVGNWLRWAAALVLIILIVPAIAVVLFDHLNALKTSIGDPGRLSLHWLLMALVLVSALALWPAGVVHKVGVSAAKMAVGYALAYYSLAEHEFHSSLVVEKGSTLESPDIVSGLGRAQREALAVVQDFYSFTLVALAMLLALSLIVRLLVRTPAAAPESVNEEDADALV